MMRIKCNGTSHDQCKKMRNKAFTMTKGKLVDLYIVKNKRANDGYCMVANATGTPKKFKEISNIIKTTSIASVKKTLKIDDVEILEGI